MFELRLNQVDDYVVLKTGSKEDCEALLNWYEAHAHFFLGWFSIENSDAAIKIQYPVEVECECPLCGRAEDVIVDFYDFQRWLNKEALIQDAFPYLSAHDRERMITGICPSCWNAQFMGYDE